MAAQRASAAALRIPESASTSIPPSLGLSMPGASAGAEKRCSQLAALLGGIRACEGGGDALTRVVASAMQVLDEDVSACGGANWHARALSDWLWLQHREFSAFDVSWVRKSPCCRLERGGRCSFKRCLGHDWRRRRRSTR
jgi:hypothetical protein